MASLKDFLSSFKTELARPNRFNVGIFLPASIRVPNSISNADMSRLLSLRCEQTELPGRTMMTHDQKIYGPTEKFAYQSAYNDIEMTFIVSGNMAERKIFDQWIDYINPIGSPDKPSFNMQYKENYVSTIWVKQYDVADNFTYGVQLFDAFPIAVNQLDLDWTNDGHHKLTVVFAYSYWTPLTN